MSGHPFRTIISAERIHARVRELGAEIARDHPEGTLYLVGVLTGSCVFLADLARAIPRPVRFAFIGASSYGSEKASSGQVKITKGLDVTVEGAHVVVVEDIVDTGTTLACLLGELAAQRPKTLRVVTLLDKPERRRCAAPVDYVGFTIPNQFVVGYGMDYDEDYRNLRDVCVLSD